VPKPAEHYTEVYFRSRNGLNAGSFFDVDEKDWSSFLKVEKFDGRSYMFPKAAASLNLLRRKRRLKR